MSSIANNIQNLVDNFPFQEADKCSICLGGYAVSDVNAVTNYCNHAFHLQCITEWIRIQTQHTCALCRGVINYFVVDNDDQTSDSKKANVIPLATSAIPIESKKINAIRHNDRAYINSLKLDNIAILLTKRICKDGAAMTLLEATVFFQLPNIKNDFLTMIKNNIQKSPDRNKSFFDAAGDKNYVLVVSLIALGADINSTDSNGQTILNYALFDKNYALAKQLITLGANINNRDNNGKTILDYALFNENYSFATKLIYLDAKINNLDHYGKLILGYALSQKNYRLSERLIDLGENRIDGDYDYKEILNYALFYNKYAIIQTMITSGKIDINTEDNFRHTLLNRIICSNVKHLFIQYLKSLGKINDKDSKDKTALDYAILAGKYDLAKELIESGAKLNINVKNDSGIMLLDSVAKAKYSHGNFIRQLLELGKINNQDYEGKTLLDYVIFYGEYKLAVTLINSGAKLNINVKNDSGIMLLDSVAKAKYSQGNFIRQLLELGKINNQDYEGKTLLDYVIFYGEYKLAVTLINLGAKLNINVKNDSGIMLLDSVARANNKLFIKKLKEINKINVKDSEGKTLLDYAELLGNTI